MDKKILVVFSALLLSSCAHVVANPNQGLNNAFLEDTLAHEEIFDESQEVGQLGIRKLDRSSSDLLEPRIGIQYRSYAEEGTDYYAVRYVAAIASLNVTASWKSAVADGAGQELKTLHEVKATVAYTSINDGGSVKEATAEGEGYNYYVVYTLRKIPVSNANNYVFAYLTLSDGSDNVSSKAVWSGISSNEYSASLEASQSGFFLSGTFGGVVSAFSADTTTRGDNAASFTTNLVDGDSFVVIQKTESMFKVWDGNCLQSAGSGFASGRTVSVSESKKYVIYLNGSNQIWHSQYGNATDYYVRGDAAGGWDVNELSSYRFVTDPDNKGILLNAHLTGGKEFKIGALNWNDYNLGSDMLIGGAKDSGYLSQTNNGASQSNILCNNSGYYNFYLTKNDYISIELVSFD